jgi:type VI secretion system protein ImpK
MRDEIADLVFPVFRQGLRLRRRLLSRQAAKLDWQREQKEILSLLQAVPKAPDALADYVGDHLHGGELRSGYSSSRYEHFLGIRYALACWIDEIMIQRDLPWNDIWNENKIEQQIYGDNLRAVYFWKQARRAEVQPSRDPLEVYYLCVVLGFRGELAEHPDKVATWRDQAEAQITEENAWTPPQERKVKPRVPLLTGSQRKQRMLLAATATALVFIPLAVFSLVAFFSQ